MLLLSNMRFIKKILLFPKKLLNWFLRLSWKKKLLATILIVILLAIISSQISAITKPPAYTLASATRDGLIETVNETGNVATNGNVELYSPSNGIVSEVFVNNGDEVIEGQELLKIESSATEQEQKTANANYLSAVTSLNAAKSNLDVLRADMYGKWDAHRNLATSGEYEDGNNNPRTDKRESAEFQISQDTWQAAEAKYKDQQTVVEQAGVSVSSTWLLYQATQNATVKATADGKIANLAVTIGSSVKAQTLTSASPPILNIANLTTTEIELQLSETDIAKIETNQKATIDIKAIDGKKFSGQVKRVDTIATNEQGIIRYNVYVQINEMSPDIRPGMTADVEIITNELKNVLTVPNSAVKPYQGGRAVRVVNPNTKEIEYLPVKIGVKGNAKTQIVSGISEGQEIITALSNDQIKRPGLF